PGHPYERTLRDVAARAKAGDLLVAEDQSTGALVGAVLFVLPGSRYAELARPGDGELRMPPGPPPASAAPRRRHAELARPGDGELRMLAVDPAAQRRGVGEALVRACLDLAADRGCRAVVISTRDVARAAQRLYARLGFTRVP